MGFGGKFVVLMLLKFELKAAVKLSGYLVHHKKRYNKNWQLLSAYYALGTEIF